jgi:hypothetical protein
VRPARADRPNGDTAVTVAALGVAKHQSSGRQRTTGNRASRFNVRLLSSEP